MSITFDRYRIDMATKACERLLSQFNNSKDGILTFLNSMVEQTQSLNDVELTVLMDRTLESAHGVQLDIIGRIVGQERPLVDSDELLWFTWDAPTTSQYWDTGPWFLSTAPTGDFVPVSDSVYRRFIVGKIFKNQVSGGTIPEVISFIRIVFKVWSSVILSNINVMEIEIKVENTIDPLYVPLLDAIRSDSNVENEYFLPIPAAVKISSVTLV